MQHSRGFIVGCANGWLWSPGRQSTPQSKLGKLFIDKKTILSAYYIWVTKWLVTCLQSNPIGTNFAGFGSNLKQFYWYKRRGPLFKLRRPLAFQLSCGLLLGAYWLAGSRSPDGGGESHHFTEPETQVPAACQPQPRQPHNTYGWVPLLSSWNYHKIVLISYIPIWNKRFLKKNSIDPY